MKHYIGELREKILRCIDYDIESKELGDFAYKSWFYFTEGEGKGKEVDKGVS